MTKQINTSIVINGRPARVYSKQGKSYIEARNGTEYAIKVENLTGDEILVVATVDGLNVVTGQKAALSNQENGYILNPYGSYTIKGFRVNNDSVGAFKFSSKKKSYAASKNDGSESNVGVIAVAAFARKQTQYVSKSIPLFRGICSQPTLTDSPITVSYTVNNVAIPDSFTTCNASTFYCDSKSTSKSLSFSTDSRSASCTPDFTMGTDWGSKLDDKVRNADFDSETYAFAVHTIYYDSRENLVDAGIISNEKAALYPQAFPNSFAQPPKNWNGWKS